MHIYGWRESTAGSRGRTAGERRERGFSLLEMVIVVCAIALLALLAIDRLWAMRVDAERVAMEQVAGSLRSALGIKVANHLAKGDMSGLRALEGSNPMDRLSELPQNYLGALADPDPASVAAGSWYFDLASRTLVYRVRNEDYFSSSLGPPARARFAIRLVYEDRNRNGRFDQAVDGLEGVRFAALESYEWTN